jgi:hypothetical protein
MSDADNLRSQIERAKRFAASMTSEAERNRFEAIASDLRRELQLVEVRGAAMVAAFQVLVNCLEENEAVLPGQFPEALRVYMEMVKSRKGEVSDMTLAMLHEIRMATLD